MVYNQTFESKVMPVWICSELPCSILSVSIYYGPQSDIQVKSYGSLNLPASFVSNFESYGSLNLLEFFVFNFEHLDILWSAIRYSSQKLLQVEFAWSFYNQFRGSRYIMVRNQTSESKVMPFWIFQELSCSISSVSIYYCPQSDIKLLLFDIARGFRVQFWAFLSYPNFVRDNLFVNMWTFASQIEISLPHNP